jgi:hypothetical protein
MSLGDEINKGIEALVAVRVAAYSAGMTHERYPHVFVADLARLDHKIKKYVFALGFPNLEAVPARQAGNILTAVELGFHAGIHEAAELQLTPGL